MQRPIEPQFSGQGPELGSVFSGAGFVSHQKNAQIGMSMAKLPYGPQQGFDPLAWTDAAHKTNHRRLGAHARGGAQIQLPGPGRGQDLRHRDPVVDRDDPVLGHHRRGQHRISDRLADADHGAETAQEGPLENRVRNGVDLVPGTDVSHLRAQGGRRGDEIVSGQVGVQNLNATAQQPPAQSGNRNRFKPVDQGNGFHLDFHPVKDALQTASRPNHAGDIVPPGAQPRDQAAETHLATVIVHPGTEMGDLHIHSPA